MTNLVAQTGNYATVGRNEISITDADSFWVDAYFEETQLAFMHEGDPAEIKLMSNRQIVSGKVGSVARGINVSNAQTDQPRACHGEPDLHFGCALPNVCRYTSR